MTNLGALVLGWMDGWKTGFSAVSKPILIQSLLQYSFYTILAAEVLSSGGTAFVGRAEPLAVLSRQAQSVRVYCEVVRVPGAPVRHKGHAAYATERKK